MNNKLPGAIFLIFLVGCATPQQSDAPNFAVVEPGIYRGGNPTPQGWQWIRSLGVTNVVMLSTPAEASEAPALKLGLHVARFPITIEEQTVGKPPCPLIESAVKEIKPGTYVCCLHGQDRTGVVVAFYRLRKCGWSREAAEQEMMELGFHAWLRGLYWAWEECQ